MRGMRGRNIFSKSHVSLYTVGYFYFTKLLLYIFNERSSLYNPSILLDGYYCHIHDPCATQLYRIILFLAVLIVVWQKMISWLLWNIKNIRICVYNILSWILFPVHRKRWTPICSGAGKVLWEITERSVMHLECFKMMKWLTWALGVVIGDRFWYTGLWECFSAIF